MDVEGRRRIAQLIRQCAYEACSTKTILPGDAPFIAPVVELYAARRSACWQESSHASRHSSSVNHSDSATCGGGSRPSPSVTSILTVLESRMAATTQYVAEQTLRACRPFIESGEGIPVFSGLWFKVAFGRSRRAMRQPFSPDLRQRIAQAVEQGGTVRAVAARFGVSVSAAVRFGQRARADVDLAPSPPGCVSGCKPSPISRCGAWRPRSAGAGQR